MDTQPPQVETCTSLDHVRTHIDGIDERIVALLAQRGGYVRQAARFKRSTDDVQAPARVAQVIDKVVALAAQLGADPAVTEQVYRAMISAFIQAELAEHAALKTATPHPTPPDTPPTPDVTLRRCTPGDEAALSLVGQATFLETFAGILGGADILGHCAHAHASTLYGQWLADPDYALWLVEAAPGDAPVGYMVLAPSHLPLADTGPGDLELKRIYLSSRFRAGGVGRRLLALATEHARQRQATRLLLGVYAHNHAAQAFYARAGFRKLGDRKFNVGGRDYDDNILGLDLVREPAV